MEHADTNTTSMNIHMNVCGKRRNLVSNIHPPAFSRPPANVGCEDTSSSRRFITFLRKNLNRLGGSGLVKKSASLSCVLTSGTTISYIVFNHVPYKKMPACNMLRAPMVLRVIRQVSGSLIIC